VIKTTLYLEECILKRSFIESPFPFHLQEWDQKENEIFFSDLKKIFVMEQRIIQRGFGWDGDD
jgi:hypothetical protein